MGRGTVFSLKARIERRPHRNCSDGYAVAAFQANILKVRRWAWIVLLRIHPDDTRGTFSHAYTVLIALFLINGNKTHRFRLNILWPKV